MTKVTLLKGDCLQKLKELEDNSVDSVVTDPPYGLEFMGKEWDSFKTGRIAKYKEGGSIDLEAIESRKGKGGAGPSYTKRAAKRCRTCGKQEWSGSPCKCDTPDFEIDNSTQLTFQEFSEAWARECYRVLKPGGHLLAFAGSRMYHRLAVGVEDAGFEIRDQIMWIYGSGFPKSHNIGNKLGEEYKGIGTALKPAHEPIVMARKPFKGNVANNVLEWGTGGINVDGCRIETTDNLNGGGYGGNNVGVATYALGDGRKTLPTNKLTKDDYTQPEGRFPANIIFDEEAGKILDEQSGITSQGHWPKGKTKGFGEFGGGESSYEGVGPKDSIKGGASRFFYCPKASKKDRDEGMTTEAKIIKGRDEGQDSRSVAYKARPIERQNIHPTVKPTDLMAYLIRLITPKGGLVLDPFMGSGSTGKAAVREGMDFIGIEREEEYMEIAKSRIEWEQKGNKHREFFDV
jgi:DNA modification methylase